MFEIRIAIPVTLLIISWAHVLYRHWRLIRELKANNLLHSSIIGGIGLNKDVKTARFALNQIQDQSLRHKLKVAALWADASPLLMFLSLVIGFIIMVVLMNRIS